MNAVETLITVIPMQVATTLKGAIVALATLDTQAMDFLAHVSVGIYSRCTILRSFILRIVSLKMEVATKTVITQKF